VATVDITTFYGQGVAVAALINQALADGTFSVASLSTLPTSLLIDASAGFSAPTGSAAVTGGAIPPAPPAPAPKKKKKTVESNKLSGSQLAAAVAVPVVFGVVCIAVVIGVAVAMGSGKGSAATKKPAATGPQKSKSAPPTEALSSDVAEGDEEEEEGSGEAPESSDAGEGSEA